LTETLELTPAEVERLEHSYKPWDKCTLCTHMDCENCEMYNDEAAAAEEEFHKWSWWLDAVQRVKQCRQDKAETVFKWTTGYAETWTLEVKA